METANERGAIAGAVRRPLSFRGKTVVLAFIAFGLSFCVYLLTLAPSVGFADAGELAAVCSTLGVAHPTGYPLFTILGHLWTKLPLPFSPIYRLNLFTAFCASVSVALFLELTVFLLRRLAADTRRLEIQAAQAATSRKKGRPRKAQPAESAPLDARASCPADAGAHVLAVALGGALVYAFARTVWEQAASIEVYSFHLVLTLLSIRLFLWAVLDGQARPGPFLLWAFVLGLSFAHHLTTVLLAPAMLFLYFKRLGLGKASWRRIALMAAPFAAGLALYLYLPLRSAPAFPFSALGVPEFDWGRVCRGWDKFVYHVTAKQYQTWMFSGQTGEVEKMFRRFFVLIPYQMAFVGLVPMALGIWQAYRQDKELFAFLVLLVAGCLGFALNYPVHDTDSFFLLAFVGLLLFVMVGLLALARYHRAFLALPFILAAIGLPANYSVNDRSRDYRVQDYMMNLIDHLESNAVILSGQWDFWTSAFWYYQRVEGYRPDVVLVEFPLLKRTWYPDQLRRWYPEVIGKSAAELEAYGEVLERFESGRPYDAGTIQARYEAVLNSFIDENFQDRPIYLTLDLLRLESNVGKDYKKVSEGLAIRLLKRDAPLPSPKKPFSLARFLSVPYNPSEPMEVTMYSTANAMLQGNMELAKATGHDAEAAEFASLLEQIQARMNK